MTGGASRAFDLTLTSGILVPGSNVILVWSGSPGDESGVPASAPGLTLAAWQPATAAADPDCGLFLADPADVPTGIPPAVQRYADMRSSVAAA